MHLRPLGKTGLRVAELALGTWGLSGDGYGPVDEATQQEVVERAIEMGISLIDTADAYGGGRMEQLLGRILADRRDVVVVTKGGTDRTTAPPRKRFDGPYIKESVEKSLRRLARRRVDVYLLHNPSVSALEGGDAVDTLTALKAEGKIGHWGVSVGDVETGRAAVRCGAEVLELAYNLIHASDMHRLAGEIVVSGVGTLARSTLAHGLLAGGWTADREFPAGDHRADRWTKLELETRVRQLMSLRFLVHGDVATMRAAAVRFVLANRIVSCAVLGPRTVTQLEDLVREVGMGPIYLRDEELMRIPRALEAMGVEP
jgi:aryl-alcohol dehydrogenase-like predicted oxidoreductase